MCADRDQKVQHIAWTHEIEEHGGPVEIGNDLERRACLTATGCVARVRRPLEQRSRVADLETVAVTYPVTQVANHFQQRRAVEVVLRCQAG